MREIWQMSVPTLSGNGNARSGFIDVGYCKEMPDGRVAAKLPMLRALLSFTGFRLATWHPRGDDPPYR